MQKAVFSIFLFCVAGFCLAEPGNEFILGPWKLGMTREEVGKQVEYGPYVPVKSTGGLETFNAVLDGKKENVSFAFGADDKVEYMQWFKYEGGDFPAAKAAALDIFRLFDSRYGGAAIHGVAVNGEERLNEGAFNAFIERTLGTSPELGEKARADSNAMLVTFDMRPLKQPPNCRLHSQLVYYSRFKVFYVFLFVDRPDAPDRTKKSLITIEKL